MLSTVLHLDLLLANRRGRWTLFRRVYAGWLVLQFLYLFIAYFSESHLVAHSRFVDGYIQVIVIQEMLVIFGVVPMFVAGTITEEKTRGTLQHLLTTDLSSAAIVLGKLGSGVLQSGLLLLTALPFVCFVGSNGAFDPVRILALVIATAGPLLAWSAVSILVSVWSRQTRHALVTLYALALGGIAFIAGINWWIGSLWPVALPGTPQADLRNLLIDVKHVLSYLNPYFVLTPTWGARDSVELARRLQISSIVWMVIAVASTGIAIWRLRPAFRKQLEAPGKSEQSRTFLFRARVSDDPIRWKEQHIEGLAPLAMLRVIPTWVSVVAVLGITIALCQLAPQLDGASLRALAMFGVATLVVAVRSSASVSGERERQTWEALLLTPLDLRRLIGSKRRGIVAATYPYLLAFALPSFFLAYTGGHIRALLVTAVALVVTLVVLQFVGAVGVWSSVRWKSSWLALLGTLSISYAGGFVLGLFAMPVIGVIVFFVCLFLSPVFAVLGIDANVLTGGLNGPIVFLCWVGLGLTFLYVAGRFNADAQRRAARERIPYYKNGVNCGWALEQYFEQLGEPLLIQDDVKRRREVTAAK
jgi:ABC-type transport system involved in multi-copper enzyme maturation permease subunit